MATSKPTTFLKDNGYEYISTGITGTSQNRQDFLVVGKEKNGILGLLVLPCVMSVNCNEELLVLAKACYPPLHIPPKTPMAIAIALPVGITDQTPPRCVSVTPENPEVLWVQQISQQRPMLTCELSNGGVQVNITGMIDTGADVSVISYHRWPIDWKLTTPPGALTGIGGVTPCLQSESVISIIGPQGKKALIRPYIVQKPITVWGRDLLSQWGAKIELGFS